MLDRRKLLRSAGAAALGVYAGCAKVDDYTSNSESSPRSTSKSHSSARRIVRLRDRDRIPDEYNFTAEVKMRNQVVTDDEPAKLSFQLANLGKKRAVLHDETTECNLFNRDAARSDEPSGLVLYVDGLPEGQGYNKSGDKWSRDLETYDTYPRESYGCNPILYSNGHSATMEYQIWDDYRFEGYFEPGSYRWEAEIEIWESWYGHSDHVRPDGMPTKLLWGFTLEVLSP